MSATQALVASRPDNLLAGPLREGKLESADLQNVQDRRLLPTRLTQRMQILMQNRVISRVIGDRGKGSLSPPWPLRLLRHWPFLRRLPARLIGIGFRPEHVRI